MNLTKNIFKNNTATIGGGGIYFKNKLLAQPPNETNIFIDNKANFSKDFLTFPVRLKFISEKTFPSWIKNKPYSLSVVPGITQTSLYFDIVDYYHQTIQSINGQ